MLGRRLRVLADDLTGALDTSAQFAGSFGPIAVRFRERDAGGNEACLAYSTATREATAEVAAARLARLGGFFDGARIAFKKIDGLLRGHTALEVASAFHHGGFSTAIVAPAFPAQGRVTRGGVQRMRQFDGSWIDVAPGFLQQLRGQGVDARHADTPASLRGAGVFFCDAETDEDLTEIVASATGLEPPLLWVGSAGLAAALGGALTPRCSVPPMPLLVIIGSVHSVSMAQILAVSARWPEVVIEVQDAKAAPAAIETALNQHSLAVARLSAPAGSTSTLARRWITDTLVRMLPQIARPAGLIAMGGETLEAVTNALGAGWFSVAGEISPGVPRSVMHGGRWDGVWVASKSGAFGDADLLRRMLERAGATLPKA